MKRAMAILVISLFLFQALIVIRPSGREGKNSFAEIDAACPEEDIDYHTKSRNRNDNMDNHTEEDGFGGSWFDDFNDESRVARKENVSVEDGKARLDGWMFNRAITLQNSGDSLTNYPVLITFDQNDFNYEKVDENGDDIRFFNRNGDELNYWIEKWNDNGQSKVWVNVNNIPNGNSDIFMFYGNPDTKGKSNALLTGVGQLKEHRKSSGTANPNFSFTKTDSTWLNIASTTASANGNGFVLYVIPKEWLDGNYLNWNWKGYYSGDTQQSPWAIRIFDGMYLRTKSTDFPDQNPFTRKGFGQLQQWAKTTYGSWGPETIDAHVDLSDSSEDYVTIFLWLGDAWAGGGVWDAWDWLEVNTNPNGIGNLVRLEFDKNVVMETTGTYNDYGLYRKHSSPEPLASIGAEQQNPTPFITSIPINIMGNVLWDALSITKIESTYTNINVSVVNASSNLTIPGYENLTTRNIDLSNITADSIRLKAWFSGDGRNTPTLESWGVEWTEENAWRDSFTGDGKCIGSSLKSDRHTVGLWHMDGNYLDSSGKNNDGTPNGDMHFVSGKYGQGASFDGQRDYVEVQDADSMEFQNGEFTISAWVYPKSYPTSNPGNYQDTIVGKWNNAGNERSFIFTLGSSTPRDQDSIIFSWSNNGINGLHCKGLKTIPLNSWSHVAVVCNITHVSLLINGDIDTTRSYNSEIFDSATPFIIGGTEKWGNQRQYFNGIIDEVCISKIARRPEEIRHAYRVGITIRGGKTQLNDNVIIPNDNTSALWHFDEVQGSVLYDSSGNGNDGTIYGADWADGVIGKALDFNGQNDYVECGNVLNMAFNDFTIEAWIKTNTYTLDSGAIRRIVEKRYNNVYDMSVFSNGKIRARIDDLTIDGNTFVGDGNWNHVAVVFDRSSNAIVYVNGENDGQTDISSKEFIDLTNINPFTIGKCSYTDAGHFNGLIDSVAIYDRALTPSEIYNHSRLYRSNATLRSETITLPSNNTWDKFHFNRSVPENTYLNISVHDAKNNETLKNITGRTANSTIDLNDINVLNHSSIYLKAHFQSNRTQTPVLFDWAVNWTPIVSPKFAKEIGDIPVLEDTAENGILNLTEYFSDVYSDIRSSNYTLEYDPSNITLELNGSIVNLTSLADNFTGKISVTVHCTNVYNRTNSSNIFNITVVNINDPPIWISAPSSLQLSEDNVSFISAYSLFQHVFDADEENLSFHAVPESNNISAVVNEEGYVNVTPWKDYFGTSNLTITVKDGSGLNSSNNIAVIVTPVNDPPYLELLSPGDNATLGEGKVTFQWRGFDVDNEVSDLSYDLYLDSNEEPRIHTSDIKGTRIAISGLEEGDTYYWHVKPSDGELAGTCLNGTWNFSIDENISIPETILLSPLNGGTLNATTVTLTWNITNLTDGQPIYHVYLGNKSEDPVEIERTLENRLELTDLVDGTSYYWYVIPVVGTLQGRCSSGVWRFSVNTTFEPIYNITMVAEVDELEIVHGNGTAFNITLVNNGNIPTMVDIDLSGVLAGFVDFPKSIIVPLGESQNITLTIENTTLIAVEEYDLVIEISYHDITRKLTIPINITSGEPDREDDDIGEDDDTEDDDEGSETDTKKKGIFDSLFFIIGIIALIIILVVVLLFVFKKKRDKEETGDEISEDVIEADVVIPDESGFSKSSDTTPPLIEQETPPQFAPSVKHEYAQKTGRAVPSAFPATPQAPKEEVRSIESILADVRPQMAPPPRSPAIPAPPLQVEQLPLRAGEATHPPASPGPQPIPSGPQIVGIDTHFSISDMFLIYVDGRLVKSVSMKTKLSEGMDEDIMSGMLTAITDFIKDSFNEESGALKSLQYGKMNIYLERGVGMYLAVVFHGHAPHNLREKMRWLLIRIWESYKLKLKVWDGSYDDLTGLEKMLGSLMEQNEPEEVQRDASTLPAPEQSGSGPTVTTATEAVMCNICMGVVKTGLQITNCSCGNKFHKSCGDRIGNCPKCNTSLVVSSPALDKVEAVAQGQLQAPVVPLPAGYMPPPPEEILKDETKMLPEYSGQRAGESNEFRI